MRLKFKFRVSGLAQKAEVPATKTGNRSFISEFHIAAEKWYPDCPLNYMYALWHMYTPKTNMTGRQTDDRCTYRCKDRHIDVVFKTWLLKENSKSLRRKSDGVKITPPKGHSETGI